MSNPMIDSSVILSECCSINKQANELKEIKDNCERFVKEEEALQGTSVAHLKEYARLIQRWKNELETEIRCLDEEIVYQMERKRLLLKALGALKIAAKINAESFACRSTKLDGDCVDEVNEELKKETYLIQDVRIQLELTVQTVTDLIENMEAVMSDLESIWSLKLENFNIECDNIGLNYSSPIIMPRYGATRPLEKDSTRNDWEKNIRSNLDSSRALLSRSYDTHVQINDHILAENQRKLRKQAQNIDVSLFKKKSVVENYVQVLQQQLKSNLNKQNEIEQLVENVRKADKNLFQFLKLEQTRLYNRSHKPLLEQYTDKAQNGLLAEDESIQRQKLVLEKDMSRLETTLGQLISVRISLERELQRKLHNLWIDSDQCPRIRALYPSASELSGH